MNCRGCIINKNFVRICCIRQIVNYNNLDKQREYLLSICETCNQKEAS